MEQTNDIVIRLAELGDMDLIMDTWQRCYGSPFWGDKKVRMGAFKLGHRKVIAACLSSAPCVVAAYAEAPHVIVGWACGDGSGAAVTQVLHYVYVKRGFRREGVCRGLLNSLGLDDEFVVTHYSSAVDRWRKTSAVTFNPYLVIS